MASEMRAKAQDRAAQWGPVAALHALILATLTRILLRLEDMILLWQQGLLPPPSSRPPAPTCPRGSARPSSRDASEFRRTRAGHQPAAPNPPLSVGCPPATPARTHAPAAPRAHASAPPVPRSVAWQHLRAPPALQNAPISVRRRTP